MKLCNTHDVPRHGIVHVFRPSVLVPLAVGVASGTFTCFWFLWVLSHDGTILLWLPIVAGAVLCLAGFSTAWAWSRESDWLLTLVPDGFYIRIRPERRRQNPAQVDNILYIPASEIEAVRAANGRYLLPAKNGGVVTVSGSFIEILLRKDNVETLSETLQREREKWVLTGDRPQELPLRVAGPGLLRLTWKLSPKARRAVEILGQVVPTAPPVSRAPVQWTYLTQEEQEHVIVELYENGEIIVALELTEFCYDCPPSQSRALLTELVRRDSADVI